MDRRKFLVKSSAASAALIVSASLFANVGRGFNSDKIINVGVIGTGDRGSGLIPFLNQIEGLNVYACCDVIPFRLEQGLARTEGKAKGFSSYKDLLKDKNIDAVLIATPFYNHSEIAIAAIKAGKHVYCEKTMAKGYDGIMDLVDQVKKSNIIFQTGHQYHSSRLYTHVVELIKNGKVGTISAVECQWNRHTNWRRAVPDPNLEKAINWRMYREYSGGLVAELCSHQIDFVNTILENNPLQVMGTGGVDYYKDGRETYDNVHLIYNYPDGVKAKFTCLTSNKNEGYQIKVLGDKGTLVVTIDTAKFYPEGKKKARPAEHKDVDGVSGATWQNDSEAYYEPINISHEDPSKQALIDFRNSIKNHKMPISNVVTGAKAAICVQMGLDAMYTNKIVSWNPDFNSL